MPRTVHLLEKLSSFIKTANYITRPFSSLPIALPVKSCDKSPNYPPPHQSQSFHLPPEKPNRNKIRFPERDCNGNQILITITAHLFRKATATTCGFLEFASATMVHLSSPHSGGAHKAFYGLIMGVARSVMSGVAELILQPFVTGI